MGYDVNSHLNLLRKDYGNLFDRSRIKELEEGKLSFTQFSNVLRHFSPIVLNFPSYLSTLSEKAVTEKHHPDVLKWLKKGAREEAIHVKLWDEFIKAHDVEYDLKKILKDNPHIRRLHENLQRSVDEGDVPLALARLTAGVEGTTGVTINRTYDSILDLFKKTKGKDLSQRQKRWLKVHKMYDSDTHPRESLELITGAYKIAPGSKRFKELNQEARNMARDYFRGFDYAISNTE